MYDMLIEKFISRLRKRILPTEHEQMVRKWYANGGDYKHRFSYDLDENSVVLDLGGYEGQWASDLFSRYLCRIYIFEPVLEFATKIDSRFKHNTRIEIFPFGLGAQTRKELISINADGSSIFKKSIINCEEVDIIDFQEWFDSKKLSSIQLMKINIEGGEYELLERLIQTGLIECVKDIQVQFHNIATDSVSRMKKIQADLQITHELTYQYRFVWENWTRKPPPLKTVKLFSV